MIAGVSCSGKYCDNLSVECAKFAGVTTHWDWHVGSDGSEYQIPRRGYPDSLSEEGTGILQFDQNHFATRIGCFGKYCDDLLFTTLLFDIP